jgi:GDP-4-dehydro-6-deoxy-D-mannose reductase
MILYNGQTGSLGRYFAAAAPNAVALRARLEDRAALRAELMQINVPPNESVSLVQMAALVSVPRCEQNPDAAHKTNVLDTIATVSDFIDWAQLKDVRAGVVYVSTGHVYARSHERLRETDDLRPRSVYAKTKLEAENILRAMSWRKKFSLTIARVFGLVAPQQPVNYVLPGLIRRVRENDLDGVSGLDYTRDYLDARDVCRILAQLTKIRWPQPETFNVCSGVPKTIRQIIDRIAWPRIVNPTAAPGFVGDADFIVGDPGKLVRATGWTMQTIQLAQTISDALDLGP